MPGLSGPDLQTQLNQRGSTLPIIFLTGHADVRSTVQTVKAGAHDFLTKPVSSDELLPAINRALEQHEASWAAKTTIDRLRALVATLTPRERQVFELVILGKTNKHVARELGSTERTVKAHRQKVMEKTKVQSLAELVSLAERIGTSIRNELLCAIERGAMLALHRSTVRCLSGLARERARALSCQFPA
jgi:FixJ family two-component response regulator